MTAKLNKKKPWKRQNPKHGKRPEATSVAGGGPPKPTRKPGQIQITPRFYPSDYADTASFMVEEEDGAATFAVFGGLDKLQWMAGMVESSGRPIRREKKLDCQTCKGVGTHNRKKWVKEEGGEPKEINVDEECGICKGTGKSGEIYEDYTRMTPAEVADRAHDILQACQAKLELEKGKDICRAPADRKSTRLNSSH